VDFYLSPSRIAWGGDPQLLAFTERYKMDVEVLDTDTMIRYHEGNFNAEDSVCCKLQYTGGSHYNLLIRRPPNRHETFQEDPQSPLDLQEIFQADFEQDPPPTSLELQEIFQEDLSTAPPNLQDVFQEDPPTPQGWDSELWRENDAENRRAIIDLMSNQQPEVLVTNQQPEEQENFLIVDEEIQLRNSRGRKKVYSPHSTTSSNSSSIASSAPDDDDVTVINDQTDEEDEPGENTEFLAAKPGQLILNNLLRDSHIITSDIVFQPIQYLLMRVRSRLKKREDFTCSNVNMRACPICLQHFQKLHSHRKHVDDPLGCHPGVTISPVSETSYA
jgi:hypothetical protein